jgi:hypothetical protein
MHARHIARVGGQVRQVNGQVPAGGDDRGFSQGSIGSSGSGIQTSWTEPGAFLPRAEGSGPVQPRTAPPRQGVSGANEERDGLIIVELCLEPARAFEAMMAMKKIHFAAIEAGRWPVELISELAVLASGPTAGASFPLPQAGTAPLNPPASRFCFLC